MTVKTFRVVGMVFLIVAAALMILNLKRVADLGTFWPGIAFFVIGLAFIARSRKAML